MKKSKVNHWNLITKNCECAENDHCLAFCDQSILRQSVVKDLFFFPSGHCFQCTFSSHVERAIPQNASVFWECSLDSTEKCWISFDFKESFQCASAWHSIKDKWKMPLPDVQIPLWNGKNVIPPWTINAIASTSRLLKVTSWCSSSKNVQLVQWDCKWLLFLLDFSKQVNGISSSKFHKWQCIAACDHQFELSKSKLAKVAFSLGAFALSMKASALHQLKLNWEVQILPMSLKTEQNWVSLHCAQNQLWQDCSVLQKWLFHWMVECFPIAHDWETLWVCFLQCPWAMVISILHTSITRKQTRRMLPKMEAAVLLWKQGLSKLFHLQKKTKKFQSRIQKWSSCIPIKHCIGCQHFVCQWQNKPQTSHSNFVWHWKVVAHWTILLAWHCFLHWLCYLCCEHHHWNMWTQFQCMLSLLLSLPFSFWSASS